MKSENDKRLNRRVAALEHDQAVLAQEQRRIKDVLRIKDNWHSEIKDWKGKYVRATMVSGSTHAGVLKWIDKYNIAVIPSDCPPDAPLVLNKGNIEVIHLVRGRNDGE